MNWEQQAHIHGKKRNETQSLYLNKGVEQSCHFPTCPDVTVLQDLTSFWCCQIMWTAVMQSFWFWSAHFNTIQRQCTQFCAEQRVFLHKITLLRSNQLFPSAIDYETQSLLDAFEYWNTTNSSPYPRTANTGNYHATSLRHAGLPQYINLLSKTTSSWIR